MVIGPGLDGRSVAMLGGTGPQGRGLARRFAAAGVPVVIGSRSADRARETAGELAHSLAQSSAQTSSGAVSGADNATAADQGDLVVVAVPWEGHDDLLRPLSDALAGKVVVDCVNPLGFDKQGAYPLPVEEGSAVQQAAALLPRSRVVGAFHHVSAVLLEDPGLALVDTDVLVLGDDREATDLVQRLAGLIPGMRGVYAGRLRNAHQVEALTANLIAINRRHQSHSGVRVTGL